MLTPLKRCVVFREAGTAQCGGGACFYCRCCLPACLPALATYLPLLPALLQELQVPTEPPVWEEVYEQPGRPMVLDLGCGYGRFLLALRWGRCVCMFVCVLGVGRA